MRSVDSLGKSSARCVSVGYAGRENPDHSPVSLSLLVLQAHPALPRVILQMAKISKKKGDVFSERIQLSKTEKILLAGYVYIRYRFFGF